jgi:glutaredoxin
MNRLPLCRTLLRIAVGCVALCALACNVIETGSAPGAPSGSAAPADAVEPAAAAPPPGSDLTSLGPGAETRIYYHFIDDRGSVRFVERLQDVPEAWRDRVGYLELDSAPPLSPGDAQRVRDERYARANPNRFGRAGVSSGAGSTATDRSGAPSVLLYYADWCGYCKKAKRHLDGKNVEYELLDVDRPDIKQELVQKTGQRGIPVIEVNGRIMKGYNAQRLDQMLDDA